jgi:hypothetical protein
VKTKVCSLSCFIAAFFLAATIQTHDTAARAQPAPGFGFQQAVGGVSVDANGLLENAGVDARRKLGEIREQFALNIPPELKQAAPLRSISLRRLNDAIEETLKAGKPISEELAFLGGLQQVRYVFVYPEQRDIVLVGPAEGWKMDDRGNIVGVTTGRSVMHLDDLVVAMRTAASSARSGISCSIDPTDEGMKQLRSHVSRLHEIGDREETAAGIEQALGRQQITVTGVPASSHLANVLVAADYRMKRLAMKFEPTPLLKVDGKTVGLPSFLDMLSGSGLGMSNIMQRWWLEPKYASIAKDADGLAWEFDGCGVKCMTEEDAVSAGGSRKHQGHGSPLAQKWADNMTRRYEALSVAEPVFGQLRNCMELAVVAALVEHERLASKAGCNLSAFAANSGLKTVEMPAPTQVDSKVSMVRKGQNWVISASGGVMIRPADFVAKARTGDAPAVARGKSLPKAGSKWCWN